MPGTRSKFGVHAGILGDSWLLSDPKANFCESGVEVGDIVVIEQFRQPSTNASLTCSEWVTIDTSGHPQERLEPLRYKVREVSVRTLTLEQDLRFTYGQVSRSATQPRPKPAPSLPPPPQECVDNGFTYRVRVADEQWLLETENDAYRHPWVLDGDRCRVDGRAQFRGRFNLGETVDDGAATFRLNAPELEALCENAPCKPYLINSSFVFTISRQTGNKAGGVTLGAASAMSWSPFDDRLYVLDAAAQTVIQMGGLDDKSSRYFETNRLE